MIGISSIASYIPDNFVDNFSESDKYKVTKDFIINKIGVHKRALSDFEDSCVDLAEKAVLSLLKKIKYKKDEIECLVFITQTPHNQGLPHSSAYLHARLGFSNNTACFDISLGCSGYVYGLSIINSFMLANGMKTGILVTSDPYSKIVDINDKNTALLFGDASTATLISENPIYKINKSVFSTDGSQLNSLEKLDGVLRMNGRDVFTFAAQSVPIQINKLLLRSSIDIGEIDLFVFHQGSKFIVETIANRMKLDKSKVPINIKNIGNTVSSSIPLILQNVLDDVHNEKIILSGFGVGLSWASMIIEKQ